MAAMFGELVTVKYPLAVKRGRLVTRLTAIKSSQQQIVLSAGNLLVTHRL